MQGWLDEWTPRAVDAAQQLQPIWSQISEKVVRFDDSLDALQARASTDLLDDIGLDDPEGDPAHDRVRVRPHVVQPGAA